MESSPCFNVPDSKPPSNSLIGFQANGRHRVGLATTNFLVRGTAAGPVSKTKAGSPPIVTVSKPKRPLTAYNIFFRDSQEKITAMKLPASKKRKLNVAAMISESWKNVTPKVRVYYHELAAQDKFRYYNEKNEYQIYLSRTRSQESKDETLARDPSCTASESTIASSLSKAEPLSTIQMTSNEAGVEQPHDQDGIFMMEPEQVGPPYYSFEQPHDPGTSCAEPGQVGSPYYCFEHPRDQDAFYFEPKQGASLYSSFEQPHGQDAFDTDPEQLGSPYYCSKRAIADLASRLDAASIDFIIRAFK